MKNWLLAAAAIAAVFSATARAGTEVPTSSSDKGIAGVEKDTAKDLTLDDFEGAELVNWSVASLNWVDGAGRASKQELARLSLNTDLAYVKEGRQSLKVECWAAKQDASYILLGRRFARDPEQKVPLGLTAATDVFSFWIYGKSGEGDVSIQLLKPGGSAITAGLTINFTGWRRIILTPTDWIEGEEKARAIWNDLYLFHPVLKGNFEIYLDDLKFVSAAALKAETAAGGFAFSKENSDVIYADFEHQDYNGLALKGVSSLDGQVSDVDNAKTVVKDLRPSILVPGPHGYNQTWFTAQEGFLPKEGAPILVSFEYYDQGENKMYWHVQGEGGKLLYYCGKGVVSQAINNSQKQEWRKDVVYFPRASFPRADGFRDLFLMYRKGDLRLTSVAVRRLNPETRRAWEKFANEEMDKLSETYGHTVVAQAYLMDEVRQAERAAELLGSQMDLDPLRRQERALDEQVVRLKDTYIDIYYGIRVDFAAGRASEADKDRKVAEYLALAEKINAGIAESRIQAKGGMAQLEKEARATHPWLAKLDFEFRSFTPLTELYPPGTLIPKAVFGRRFLVGAPGVGAVRAAAVRPFGLLWEYGGLSSGFLPNYCIGEDQYDFTKLDAAMTKGVAEYGIRGGLETVYAGWWRKFLPQWFINQYGDAIYPMSHDGTVGKGGGNIYHPALRKLWIDYAKAMGGHLKDNPDLFMAMFLGEAYNNVTGNPADNTALLEDGYDPVAVKGFQERLKDKYQSIDNLNRQWESSYGAITDIVPPKAVERRRRMTPLIYEFEKYREDTWNDLQDAVFQAYKEADPNHQVTCVGGSRSEFDPITVDAIGCLAGGYGLSHHSPWLLSWNYSINRLSGKPMICREYNITGDEGRMGLASTRGELRAISERGFWQSTAWNMSGALLYCIGSGRDNIMENDANQGVIRWFAGNVPLMRDKWDRLSKVYTETSILHFRIGFLHNELDSLMQGGSGWFTPDGITRSLDLHKKLFINHYNWFFVREKSLARKTDRLDDYRFLIVGNTHMEEGLVNAVLDWTRKGGTLVLGGGAGAYDPFGRYSGKLYRETLGVTEVEFDPVKGKKIGVLKYGGKELDLKGVAEHFWYVKNAKLNPGVKTLGVYADGSPALFEGKYGKGTVYASVFPLGCNEALDDIFVGWLKATIPLLAATCSEPLVESVLREDKAGNRYLLLTNLNFDKKVQARCVLDGHYEKLVDLGLGNGIPVESKTAHGLTVFERAFAAGEGTIVRLGRNEATRRPAARAKAAWAEYLFTEQNIAAAQKEGLNLAGEPARLAEMAAAIEQGKFSEALVKAEAIGKSIEEQRAGAGGDKLRVLARELAGRIAESKRKPIDKARIEALRKMGEYAISGKRQDAESYLNTAQGWINLPELPVRRAELDFKVPKTKGLAVDGDLKEWADAQWQSIPYTRAWHGNPRGPADIDANFATMWDEDYFYLAVKVTDDKVMNEAKTVDTLWEQDSIEVHFNVLDDIGLPKPGGAGDGLPLPIYGPDDFQFGFDVNGQKANGLSPLKVSLEGSKVGIRKAADGYQMEVAIPWKTLFLTPVAGYTLGFTLSVNDCDTPGAKYEKQLTWRGREVCNNTEGWGRMELAE